MHRIRREIEPAFVQDLDRFGERLAFGKQEVGGAILLPPASGGLRYSAADAEEIPILGESLLHPRPVVEEGFVRHAHDAPPVLGAIGCQQARLDELGDQPRSCGRARQ